MVKDRFLVEADRKPVGVAVRVDGGFQFFSSDPAYLPVEGRIFPRARALARHVADLARKLRAMRRRSGEGGSRS